MLSRLSHRVNRDRPLAPRQQEAFEGFLTRLLGHEAGVGVIPVSLELSCNTEVVLSLAEPA